MTYKGKAWATLRLEASPPEAQTAEPERIGAFSLTQLGLDGPTEVTCQSLRYQMATKLHAVTERFDDRENDRFRDLIDLLLLAILSQTFHESRRPLATSSPHAANTDGPLSSPSSRRGPSSTARWRLTRASPSRTSTKRRTSCRPSSMKSPPLSSAVRRLRWRSSWRGRPLRAWRTFVAAPARLAST